MLPEINAKRALRHLLDLLGVEALSGHEQPVADMVTAKLVEAGCDPAWISSDQVHKTLPDFERGNLIVKLPGTGSGLRLLFAAHMDTVPLCRGARPVQHGDRIESAGDTALGADNRTAVAALVTLVETLLSSSLPYPPITLLFSVGEEIGLLGASAVKLRNLGNPKRGFNIDSGDPGIVVCGATGCIRIEVTIRGISAHAGMHPEDGVSAILIASRAIKDIADRGYFGRIRKGKKAGTSNVGIVQGGEATNQVTDQVYLRAEARSHDPVFLTQIVKNYRLAFESAASAVRNRSGQAGTVEWVEHAEYDAFELEPDEPVVQQALRAAATIGLTARTCVMDGGLDANPLNARGVPTVTLGAGQHGAHTVGEYADIPEYLEGCRLALAIALSD